MKRPEQHIQKAPPAHDEMRAAGAEVAVAVGVDQAIAQLKAWHVLGGRSQ